MPQFVDLLSSGRTFGRFQAEASMGQVACTLLAMSLYTQAHTQAFPWIINNGTAGSKNGCMLHFIGHF